MGLVGGVNWKATYTFASAFQYSYGYDVDYEFMAGYRLTSNLQVDKVIRQTRAPHWSRR